MVNTKAAFKHLSQPQDLWQLPVTSLQPAHSSVKEEVDLALLRRCCEVHVRQRVCQQVHLFLGETEDHGRQQLPVSLKYLMVLWRGSFSNIKEYFGSLDQSLKAQEKEQLKRLQEGMAFPAFILSTCS